jgi:hypothetical protein
MPIQPRPQFGVSKVLGDAGQLTKTHAGSLAFQRWAWAPPGQRPGTSTRGDAKTRLHARAHARAWPCRLDNAPAQT